MPGPRWPRQAAAAAAAASLIIAAAACSASASPSSAGPGSSAPAAPLSQAALIAGSKHEHGLLIFSNALLSQMRVDVLQDFLDNPSRFGRQGSLPVTSPSEVIVADLERRGYA